jgi:hypothetical protein
MKAGRSVWELLIIYRALQHIKELRSDFDPVLQNDLRDLEAALEVAPHKPNFFEVLLSTKKTIGVKIDANAPSETSFYAGLEPVPVEAHREQPISLKLVDYKRHLERFLKDRKLVLYVLFDRLDDFVAQEDYETQRLLMHGLLSSQLDYRQKYQHVKIKAFIRTDLFRKLDISEFGADKILSRCVQLSWTPSAIKQFIGTRIAANLMQSLNLDSLVFQIEKIAYEMSRAKLADLKTIRKTMEGARFWQWKFWVGLWRLVTEFEERKPNEGRVRNSSDVINETLITSILPTEVPHLRENGVEDNLNVFEYFDSHFQFGHGETTPRAMLAFLTHFLSEVNKYYLQNEDIEAVDRNENCEYPLFVKVAVRPAYDLYCRDAWAIQANWAAQWRSLVAAAERLALRNEFSFTEFLKSAQATEDETRQFLAFATMTGLVRCINDGERHNLRRYQFPVVFRKIQREIN